MRKVVTIFLAFFGAFNFMFAQIDDGDFDFGDLVAEGPSVVITEPSVGSVFTVSQITVRGQTASSPQSQKRITGVQVAVVDGLSRRFNFGAAISTPCGTSAPCSWEVKVTLQPGRNTLRAEATDEVGLQSVSDSVAVTYNAPGQTPLTMPGEVTTVDITFSPVPPPPPPGAPLSEFEQMFQQIGQVQVGAGYVLLRTALISLVLVALYFVYTRTGFFRRREIEHLVDESHKAPPDFKEQ